MKKCIKVLFVDDDEEDFYIVNKYLSKIKRTTFKTDRADCYKTALEAILKDEHDVYLIDYKLGIETGIDLLREVMSFGCDKPIIFLTGQKNKDIDIQAMNLGATDYLIKDQIDPQILERSIRYSIERKKLEKKIKQEKALKEMIIDITVAAICIVDVDSDEIIDVNKSLLHVFDINKEDLISKKFHETFIIRKYRDELYNNGFEKTHACIIERCPCIHSPIDCNVSVKNKTKDCLLSCKSIEFNNGEKKLLRIVTLIDTTRQKMAEKKLLETTIELQDRIKEFGIEKKDPMVILSLIGNEIDKIENIEEMSERWTG